MLGGHLLFNSILLDHNSHYLYNIKVLCDFFLSHLLKVQFVSSNLPAQNFFQVAYHLLKRHVNSAFCCTIQLQLSQYVFSSHVQIEVVCPKRQHIFPAFPLLTQPLHIWGLAYLCLGSSVIELGSPWKFKSQEWHDEIDVFRKVCNAQPKQLCCNINCSYVH